MEGYGAPPWLWIDALDGFSDFLYIFYENVIHNNSKFYCDGVNI